MLPETHPLIDSITRPLDDNPELKLSAAQILQEKFDPEHPSIPEALERLEKQDRKKFPALGRIVLWVLAVVGLGIGIYTDRETIWTIIEIENLFGYEDSAPKPLPPGLTEQEKLILGDPDLDELAQREQLFQSDPDNPAYYAEYAFYYASEHNKLPPGFFKTVERIDPKNSFFLYWAAGEIIGNSLERLYKGSPKSPRYLDGMKLRPLPTESEYSIKDRTAYDQALELIEKASELPNYNNYQIDMMKARVRIVSNCNTVAGLVRAVDVQYEPAHTGIISMIKVSKLLDARAEELSKNGDKEAFILFSAQRDAFMARWAHNENHFLVTELVYNAIASSTAVNFHAGAARLGLTEIEETYRKQSEDFTADRDLRDIRRKKEDVTENFINAHASALSRLSVPMLNDQVKSPPVLSDADLKPMRMVEHELLGRLGIYSLALILLPTTLFVFICRFLASCSIRLIAKRIASLLKLIDWIWIFSLGVALPILTFVYINRLSPVSGRDYGSSYFLFVFPGLHLSALLATLLLAPAIVTRWRLKLRAAAFGFGSRIDLLSIPVVGVMLIYAVVAYPVMVKIGNLNTVAQIGLAAPLVGWLGFVFFNGLRMLLGNARSRIIQTATAIAVIPSYALAIPALCLILPLYHAGEKHWIVRDKLHLIDPDAPDLGAYEFKVAAQKRKEINAIMGY